MVSDDNQCAPAIRESLTSKGFRSTSTNDDQPQLEISGFGVRVPGGAQKPRSRECPGLLHVRTHLLLTLCRRRDRLLASIPRHRRPRPSTDRDCASHHIASHRCRLRGSSAPASVEQPTLTPVGGIDMPRPPLPIGTWGEISTRTRRPTKGQTHQAPGARQVPRPRRPPRPPVHAPDQRQPRPGPSAQRSGAPAGLVVVLRIEDMTVQPHPTGRSARASAGQRDP